jgi:hypothetical protein
LISFSKEIIKIPEAMERFNQADLKTNKDIIITLIQADLKHNQLLGNLRQMALYTDEYHLPLHKAVSQLMGLGEETYDQWFDIYEGFLIDAHKYPISGSPDNLLSVAEKCYELLCASIRIENHMNQKTKKPTTES